MVNSHILLQIYNYFFETTKMCLFFRPGLGLVEHGDVAADLQVVAVEPDGTLVGLAVFLHLRITVFCYNTFLFKI